MIAGRLEHLKRYAGLHPDLNIGLEAIAGLQSDATVGEYRLNDRVLLIISSYTTTHERTPHYEAHTKMIDIQYAVTGLERVDWSPLPEMIQAEPYDESRDRAFWAEPSQQTGVVIGNGVFAVFFPEDAHRPCLPAPAGAEVILKATVKIENWE